MAGRAMAPPRRKANLPFTPEPASTQEATPLEERIRTRAYEIYLERNGIEGNEVDDWLRAESEIRGTEEPGSAGGL